MKRKFTTHLWKRGVSMGLSLVMAISPLFQAMPVQAELSDSASTTPNPIKAGCVPIPEDGSTRTEGQPFAPGTAGSEKFRIPAIITMENGELLAIADARYGETMDGNGLDTIASVSSDGGRSWEYGFPFFFPDSYRDAYYESTAFIDPGLLEGPDGTLYCIADAFPTSYSLQNKATGLGTGYVTVDGELHLALTDDYSKVTQTPVDEGDSNYLYYVDAFDSDGFAQILKREDGSPSGYGVDEWYNLYSVDENGEYQDNLRQAQVNQSKTKVQQNVYYKDSKFHVYETGYMWMITSKDHGRTWEHPRDIISQIKKEDERALLVSPGRGITTSDGTLAIGLYYHGKGNSTGEEKASMMYSTDNGNTWQRTDDIVSDNNVNGFSSENEIVELENGTLRMFFRNGSARICYADFTKNADGGYDVGEPVRLNDCTVTSTCNVTAISYSKKINGKQAILVACPEGNPAGSGRVNGQIFIFLVNEEGAMSLYRKVAVPKSANNYHYSSMTELEDGSIGLLWETRGGIEIVFDRYEIQDLAPNASLEGAAGATAVHVTVEKGETYELIEPESAGGDLGVSPEAPLNEAVAKMVKKSEQHTEAPLYTDANKQATMDPADAEVTITRLEEADADGDAVYNIVNTEGKYYSNHVSQVVFVDASDDATRAITLEANEGEAEGTFKILTKNASGGSTRHMIFNATNPGSGKLFDAVDQMSNEGWKEAFHILKKKDGTSPDDIVPGYEAVSEIESGAKYLITYVTPEQVYVWYPRSFNADTVKYLGEKVTTNSRGKIAVTGVNEGYTRAILDGVEYRIRVTDHITCLPSDRPIELPFASSYDVSTIDSAIADAQESRGGMAGMYDHVSNSADSLSSFSTTANTELSLANAEFTFTRDSSDNTKWNIKSGSKYLVQNSGSLFAAEPEAVSVPQTEGADTFRLCNEAANSSGRYVLFYTTQMNINSANGYTPNSAGYRYEFTLWKKDASALDSMLSGYRRVVAGEEITDGGVYLISYVWTQNEEENVIVIYPPGGNSAGNDVTKLAYRVSSKLTITPKKPGLISFTVDGKKYKYQFTLPDCTHPADNETIRGAIAPSCDVDGYTGDKVCDLCNEIKSEGSVLPATGHTWVQTPVTLQAMTEEVNGVQAVACGNCKLHTREIITYAAAYKRLKQEFLELPDELTEAKRPLYDAADIAKLQAAFDAGAAVADKDVALQTNKEMYGCLEAFQKALDNTHYVRNQLEASHQRALAIAGPIYSAGLTGAYSEADWNAFRTAYNNANIDISQTRYMALQALTNTLKEKTAILESQTSRADLQELYDAHKKDQKGDYTDKTWSIFTEALKNAAAVLARDEADNSELVQARETLEAALAGLKTNAELSITAPGMTYTVPVAGAYPQSPSITAGDSGSIHGSAVCDWAGNGVILEKRDEAVETEIVNMDGVWGFNGQLQSSDAKFNVHGQGNALAMTFKLYLKKAGSSERAEILAKGYQYAFQLKYGKLTLFMQNGSDWPTEEFTVTANHLNKWLDIVILFDGQGKQGFYVDGVKSTVNTEASAVIPSGSLPFTIGYNPRENYDSPNQTRFTSDFGYLADIKFYDGEDVSDGMSRDYGAICNLLEAEEPAADITSAAYSAKTVWSAMENGRENILSGTDKFAADISYKATTTFTAYGDYMFTDTDAYRAEVADNVVSGSEYAKPVVTVSSDKKTMTVAVVYLTELEQAEKNLTEALEQVRDTISVGEGIYTPSTWEQFTKAYEAANHPKDPADAAELQKLAADLVEAFQALKRIVPATVEDAAKYMLQIVYDAYQGFVDNTAYTQVSRDALKAALEAAKTALESGSDNDVSSALTNLMKAAVDLDLDTQDADTALQAAQAEAEAAKLLAEAAQSSILLQQEAIRLADAAAKAAQEAADKAKALAEAAEKKAQDAALEAERNRQAAEQAQKEAKAAQDAVREALAKLEAAEREARENKAQMQQAASSMDKAAFIAGRVVLNKVKSNKKKQAALSWKRVKGADGYVIQYATKSCFEKAKRITIKKGTTVKKTVKKLKSNQKYYFRVRAYKTYDGLKVYGKYSATRSVKVK